MLPNKKNIHRNLSVSKYLFKVNNKDTIATRTDVVLASSSLALSKELHQTYLYKSSPSFPVSIEGGLLQTVIIF